MDTQESKIANCKDEILLEVISKRMVRTDAVASRRTRGPVNNISFGAPVRSVTKHSVVTGVPNITSVSGYEVNQFVLDIRAQIVRFRAGGLK